MVVASQENVRFSARVHRLPMLRRGLQLPGERKCGGLSSARNRGCVATLRGQRRGMNSNGREEISIAGCNARSHDRQAGYDPPRPYHRRRFFR
jgi:hypothetical protein